MKKLLVRLTLVAGLAAGLAAGSVAQSPPAQAGYCWGINAIQGTVLSGPYKGWKYVKNVSKTTVFIVVYEGGQVYGLNTLPGKTYYFEDPNTRFTCG